LRADVSMSFGLANLMNASQSCGAWPGPVNVLICLNAQMAELVDAPVSGTDF
jgi:hypothetical protein